MKSLAGQLLIAPSQEHDPDFAKAVLLVVQHSAEQALGLVLNRPTLTTIKQAWKGRSGCECHQHVYWGGPVLGPLMAVHTEKLFADLKIGPGLYYSARKKNLERLLQQPDRPLKMFEGHVGWGPGQFEDWVEAGGWLLLTASHRHVFDVSLDLWKETLQLAQHGL